MHITLHNADFTFNASHVQGRLGEVAVSPKGEDQADGVSQGGRREGLWSLSDHLKNPFSHTAETSHNKELTQLLISGCPGGESTLFS